MHPMQNRLTKLLALNRNAPREYKIEAAADGAEATIYLYDVIGYDFWSGGGVTAKQFAGDLKALGSKTLHLRVNSPGGDVFEGRAMVAALQAYAGKVVAHIDGLAASAASFLVMHADEIEMTDGSFMMIHNGWTLAMGDRHAMTDIAALLEKIDGSIADDYLTRTAAEIDREQVAQWMDAETWFTASEAIANGLADRVAVAECDKGKKTQARAWNVAAYDHPPIELETAPEEPAQNTNLDAEHADRLRAIALVEKCTA